MTSGINYFFDNYTNLDPATFKVFYNFDNSGSGVVPSVPLANSSYSGSIINYSPSFWSYSGSGFFTGSQYVRINNTNSGLFSGSNLSFLTIVQKSNTNNNILFSCADTGLVGTSFAYRGFTFGINAANKLYFEYYGPSGLEIYTLPNILAERNSLSVVLSEETVMLGQYDFFNQQLNSQSFPINSNYIFNGDSWKIGSNSGAPFFSYTGNSPFWLDLFCIWNTALSETDLQFINSGIISNVITTGQISGYIQTVITTGVQTGQVPAFSGVTGWLVNQTGIITDFAGNIYTGIIPPLPLTGVTYATGIVFLTGIQNTAILTGIEDQIIFDWQYAQGFAYDGINYIFDVNSLDTSDVYLWTGFWNTISGRLVSQNSSYNKIKNTFNSNVTGEIVYYLNGVQNNSGVLVWDGNLYNPVYALQYDFTLTGFSVDSLGFYSGSDSNIYDVFNNNQTVLTGYSYTGSGLNLVTSGNQKVLFLNGQKLYSGINYIKSGANYYITSLYSGASGNLTIIDIPTEFYYRTGNISGGAIFSSYKFPPSWSLPYLNGVRSYLNERYIEISNKDLLSGSGNFLGEYISSQIYQNSDLFFES